MWEICAYALTWTADEPAQKIKLGKAKEGRSGRRGGREVGERRREEEEGEKEGRKGRERGKKRKEILRTPTNEKQHKNKEQITPT